jgi:hypothetical protein
VHQRVRSTAGASVDSVRYADNDAALEQEEGTARQPTPQYRAGKYSQAFRPAAITPTAALAAKAAHNPRFAADDPVFAAIEWHCQAAQALAALHQPPDALEQDGVTSTIVKAP